MSQTGHSTPMPAYDRLAQQAEHHEKHGHPVRAAGLYRLAGEQAARNLDPKGALDWLERSLALTPDTALQQRFDILLLQEKLHASTSEVEARGRILASLEALGALLGEAPIRQVTLRQADYRLALGDTGLAVTLGRLALRLARLDGDELTTINALLLLGQANIRQSSYSMARSALRQALAISDRRQEIRLQADARRWLGVLSNETGDFTVALDYYEQAEALYHQINDRQGLVSIQTNTGHVLLNQGRLGQASQYWEAARQIYDELGDRAGAIRIRINLSAVSTDVGSYELAERYSEEALQMSRAISLRLGECFALLNLGLVAHYQGRQQAAIDLCQRALMAAQALASRRLQGHALSVLGHALAAHTNVTHPVLANGLATRTEAAAVYWEALSIWEELGLANLAAETRAGLARLALSQGDLPGAVSQVDEILAQETRSPGLEGAEAPVRILMTCYQVLEEARDDRAGATLAQAHGLLESRAAAVIQDAARQSLLTQVAAHRDLLAIVHSRAVS